MLQALAAGETEPAKLAALADPALRATVEQLEDSLSASLTLSALHREILGLFLARLQPYSRVYFIPRCVTGWRSAYS